MQCLAPSLQVLVLVGTHLKGTLIIVERAIVYLIGHPAASKLRRKGAVKLLSALAETLHLDKMGTWDKHALAQIQKRLGTYSKLFPPEA